MNYQTKFEQAKRTMSEKFPNMPQMSNADFANIMARLGEPVTPPEQKPGTIIMDITTLQGEKWAYGIFDTTYYVTAYNPGDAHGKGILNRQNFNIYELMDYTMAQLIPKQEAKWFAKGPIIDIDKLKGDDPVQIFTKNGMVYEDTVRGVDKTRIYGVRGKYLRNTINTVRILKERDNDATAE